MSAGGSEGGRVEHSDRGACSDADTRAERCAEAGDGRSPRRATQTQSGGADDERSESDSMSGAMSLKATSLVGA